jgi:polyferredoxin
MKFKRRRITQFAALIIANPYLIYFASREIYQGALKGVCFPGFNCYACPLAVYSCPIGALQHSAALLHQKVKWTAIATLLYVGGFIALIGIGLGRLVCGWFCPFGLIQEGLNKIPSPKLRIPHWMRYGKYLTLAGLVLLLPLLTGVHWFSRLCPAGALEGTLPLEAVQPKGGLPPAGWFFWLKIGILVFFVAWMVVSSRPFCRTACPLGACFALCTRFSAFRMHVDKSKCTECDACRDVCPVEINIYEDANSPECLRCLDCKKACPASAITSGFKSPLKAGSPSDGRSGTAAS